jgi:hypothetical protein
LNVNFSTAKDQIWFLLCQNFYHRPPNRNYTSFIWERFLYDICLHLKQGLKNVTERNETVLRYSWRNEMKNIWGNEKQNDIQGNENKSRKTVGNFFFRNSIKKFISDKTTRFERSIIIQLTLDIHQSLTYNVLTYFCWNSTKIRRN